jgi:hypothetical protein
MESFKILMPLAFCSLALGGIVFVFFIWQALRRVGGVKAGRRRPF